MSPRAVVAAVIRREGAFLVAQRPPTKHYPLQWEFPGGKVESGESPEEALRREIREELDVEIEVGPLIERVRHDYGEGHDYDIRFFQCRIVSGEPRAKAEEGVHRIEWVAASRLADLDFLVGNRRIVARLRGAST